jgi:hypothetical protein
MTTFWILWWESSLFPSSSFHSICTNEFWLRVKSQQDGRRKKKLYNSLVGQYGTSRGYFFIQRWEKVLTSHRHSPFLWLWTVISFFFFVGGIAYLRKISSLLVERENKSDLVNRRWSLLVIAMSLAWCTQRCRRWWLTFERVCVCNGPLLFATLSL